MEPGSSGKGQLFELARELSAPSYFRPRGAEKVVANAKTVDFGRIALLAKAAGCDPADHLKEPARSRYLDLASLDLPPHQWNSLPKACHKVRAADEVALAMKLYTCGMGSFVEEKKLWQTGPCGKPVLLTAGWFAVDHETALGRLICDRRPRNAAERRLHLAKLPSGTQFTALQLRKGETVRGCVDN